MLSRSVADAGFGCLGLICGAVAPLLLAVPAWADEPAGLSSQEAASSGTSSVAQEGFQKATLDDSSADATTLNASAGGLLASGNSRSMSLTGLSTFRLRRGIHQFGALAAANYGRASAGRDVPVTTTISNLQARARYDLFFARHMAGFFQASARRDRFQGLNLRLNLDPGFAYYFIDQKQHQLWGEIGYDLQYDVRRDSARLDEATGDLLAKTETRHNGRLFAGYDNQLNKAVTFATGLEYLQGLSPFEDELTRHVNWRVNWDLSLTSKISDKLAVATTFSLKHDNNPLPGLARTDTVSAVSLVCDLY